MKDETDRTAKSFNYIFGNHIYKILHIISSVNAMVYNLWMVTNSNWSFEQLMPG